MRNSFSTPTVSFADRQDYRPRVWTPGIQRVLSDFRVMPESSNVKRGFNVSAADVRLMSSWLRGKL
jgi:hypothetical protein